MAYDEDVAARVRMAFVALNRDTEERKMFGGIAWMVKGHMVAGVGGKDGGLMIRCGPARAAAALERPHTKLFDMTGRPMTSIIEVAPAGYADDAALADWLALALDFIDTEPPKKPKPRKRKAPPKPKL